MILTWDDYFMSVAQLSSLRSKDPRTQVGACIVDKNKRVVGIGYNGMPNKCKDSCMSWNVGEGLDNKHLYVVHAELNAILNSKMDLTDCVLYTTLFPCNECTKAIIQASVKEIVYLDDKYKDYDMIKASKFMLDLVGIKYRQLKSDVTYNIDLRGNQN